jgi:hypothetical protein
VVESGGVVWRLVRLVRVRSGTVFFGYFPCFCALLLLVTACTAGLVRDGLCERGYGLKARSYVLTWLCLRSSLSE